MKVTKLKGNPVYLTAKTLDPGTFTVAGVEIRKFNEEERLVVMLQETTSDLKLSPHQVLLCARVWGDESADWIGQKLALARGEPGIDVTPVPAEPGPGAAKEH